MRAPHHRNTWAEYLAIEGSSTVKHEFFDGEIYAMGGGTPAHAALSAAVVGQLWAQLNGRPCRVYTSDLRIRVLATGLGTYPDVSVVCGELQYDPEKLHDQVTVTNPTVIVEVLSDSTEEYDRGVKFQNYQQIPSLREYVLVSQREQLVELFHRSGSEWTRVEARRGASLRLESIDCELETDRIYAGVDLSRR